METELPGGSTALRNPGEITHSPGPTSDGRSVLLSSSAFILKGSASVSHHDNNSALPKCQAFLDEVSPSVFTVLWPHPLT